jgi:NCS1 family nucleobase:cation symporter-1
MNASAGTAATQAVASAEAVEHYWHFAKERIDVDALFEPPSRGRVADVHWPAIFAFAVGMVATWAFSYGVPTFLQGPGARALGNVDLSWLAGAVAAGLVYYVAGTRSARVPVPEVA